MPRMNGGSQRTVTKTEADDELVPSDAVMVTTWLPAVALGVVRSVRIASPMPGALITDLSIVAISSSESLEAESETSFFESLDANVEKRTVDVDELFMTIGMASVSSERTTIGPEGLGAGVGVGVPPPPEPSP